MASSTANITSSNASRVVVMVNVWGGGLNFNKNFLIYSFVVCKSDSIFHILSIIAQCPELPVLQTDVLEHLFA